MGIYGLTYSLMTLEGTRFDLWVDKPKYELKSNLFFYKCHLRVKSRFYAEVSLVVTGSNMLLYVNELIYMILCTL